MRVTLLHFYLEDYSIQLANGLADHVDLTLIHPTKVSAVYQKFLNPRIRVHSFEKPRSRDPRNWFAMAKMMRFIRESQPDVLHVQDNCDYWYDLTLLLNPMPPLVTTIHDVFRHPGDRSTTFGTEYTKQISFYKSQKLIVHAQFLKDQLVESFNVGQERVHVLPHGELGSLYQRRANLLKPVEREANTLLFFGRIWPYKGLKYLLEAMPLVAKKIPDVKLIIAGRGEELYSYFPNGYDPKRYEILNEFIPAETVAELFGRSAITVLPYIESSQSGVAAIAYAQGSVVIASNIGGLSEMIHHNQDGVLVPPEDVEALAIAIIDVLKDSDRQQKLRAAALRRCENDLNWSNIAARTVEVYQELIQ